MAVSGLFPSWRSSIRNGIQHLGTGTRNGTIKDRSDHALEEDKLSSSVVAMGRNVTHKVVQVNRNFKCCTLAVAAF